jgi:MFS family permease
MKIELNKIVKYLIYSDLIFYTGWGLISPIFALFLVEGLKLTAFVVGMSSAVNLIVRSLLRIPFGIRVDRHHNQRKAFNYMFWGLLIAAIIPIGYIFASNQWHIYILQAILGAVLAMSTAGWTGIFSRNMDKGKESTEWGVDAVAVGIGPGIAAALGGLAVTYFSFNWVFIAVTIVGIIGALFLLVIKNDIVNKKMEKGAMFHMREAYRLKKNHTRL